MPTTAQRLSWIDRIRRLPDQVEELVSALSVDELSTPYLAGEWSVAQNVHHLADSHMNSYIRCKLIAAEDYLVLKPYDQNRWARFPDASAVNLSASLALLRSLHTRWVLFWESLPDDAWSRSGHHPESGAVSLDDQLQLYAEHGEAHIDQIQRTLAAAGHR